MLKHGGFERFDVWINAAAASPGLRLFGLSLIERQLAAIDEFANYRLVCAVGSVVVEHPRGAPPRVEANVARRLDVRFVEAEGSLRARLARAARAATAPLLALEGDAVVDTRVLGALLEGTHSVAVIGGENAGRTAILRLAPGSTLATEGESLLDVARQLIASGAARELRLDSIDPHLPKLRRDLPAYAFRMDDADARATERWLFWSNYKGSTDFLTRWVFPPLVWPAVRRLARYRVHPNWVTALAVTLCFAAVPLWASAHWVAGFLAALAMAVLDSVDGKLARLTHRTSWLGNLLDHGTDLVHPPFWVAAWAYGLAGGATPWVQQLALSFFGLYAIDRALARIFRLMTGRSIHGFAPIDRRMRTVISRRNVNLAVFMIALPLGLGARALELIAAWQALCLLFHAVRTVQVAWQLGAREPLGAG